MRTCRALLLAVLAAAVAPAAAGAATWSAPTVLTSVPAPGLSFVGAGSIAGDALLVVRTGTRGSQLGLLPRSPGLPFAAPHALAGTTARSAEPSVAVAGVRRLVAWRQDTPRAYRGIRAALGDAAPVTLAGVQADGVRQPDAAIDGSGTAVVAFLTATHAAHLNQRGRIALAVRRPGRPFAPARTITATQAQAPVVGMADGAAVVAWVRDRRVEAVAVDDGRIGKVVVLGAAPSNDGLAVAVGPGGVAVVAWTRRSGRRSTLVAATRRATGTFGAPVLVRSSPTRVVRQPAAAVAAGGRLLLAWHEEDYAATGDRRPRGYNGIFARVRFTTGTTGLRPAPARALSPAAGYASSPAVTALAAGGFAVAWTFRDTPAESGVRARFVLPGGPEATTAELGAPLTRPEEVARPPLVLPAGDGASVVWAGEGGRALLVADGRATP